MANFEYYYNEAKKELAALNIKDFNGVDHLAEYIIETITTLYTDNMTDEESDNERNKLVKAVYKAIKEL